MSTQEIALLQKERAKAIEDYEFQKAKAIEIHIKRLSEQLQHNNQTKKRINSELSYESEKEAVRKEASKIFADAYETVYQVKAKFQDRMSSLHKCHAEQLKAQADAYSCELELCSTRGVPDSNYLKKEAKSKAKHGDYDLADSLYQQSNQVHEQTITMREDEVHKIFALKSEQLAKKHREENELCKEKERTSLQEITINYEIDVNKLKKRLTAASLKFQIPQDLEEEETFFDKLEIDEDMKRMSDSLSPSPKKSRSQASTPPVSPKSPGSQTSPSDPNTPDKAKSPLKSAQSPKSQTSQKKSASSTPKNTRSPRSQRSKIQSPK